MKKTELPSGLWMITSPNGVTDRRNGRLYSEVVCKREDAKYFI